MNFANFFSSSQEVVYKAIKFLKKRPLLYFKMALLSPKKLNFDKNCKIVFYSATSPKIWYDSEGKLYMILKARYVMMEIGYNFFLLYPICLSRNTKFVCPPLSNTLTGFTDKMLTVLLYR